MSPSVLRVRGFVVKMYPPPREHGPAHVHVRRAEGSISIQLDPSGGIPIAKKAKGISERDIEEALTIVWENQETLWRWWRRFHA